jgi:hypothetical protein
MAVTRRQAAIAQWMSVVVAPVVYLGNLSLAYALVQFACNAQTSVPLHFANGITLVLMLVAVTLAWRARHANARPIDVRSDDVGRDRFLSTIGLCVSGLLVLAVAGQWGAQLALSPCFS